MGPLLAMAVMVSASEPEPESHGLTVSVGVPVTAGATLQPSAAGLSGRFALALRPELSVHPFGTRGLGVGPYLTAGTLRSFTDFAAGGGLTLTPPWPFAVRPVLSAGALATLDARGWAPCLEAGLFFGVHSGFRAMAVAGLRADVHVWFSGDPRWSLTLSLAFDLEWPVQLGRILFAAAR
ncbi:MAG: hypothetical protein IPJ65_00125 [Archangiaceae bacterium]|nr:hypothetical protein [Archangiaceae bacterium]